MASPDSVSAVSALPEDLLRIEAGSISHPGVKRAQNEDSLLVAPEIGVFAVADGMGGHEDGALASATIVGALASIGAAVSAADLMARLEDRILRANAELRAAGQARNCVIGSTLAVLLLFGRDYACVWSGDSRIYRIRDGLIEQITRDHTEGRDLFERGILTAAEMESWPRRHVLTRALGVDDRPELESEQGVVSAGDVFVICSDGLTAHVTDGDILLAADTSAPQWACDSLLDLTLERGASDNVTTIVIRCGYRGRATEAPRQENGMTVLMPAGAAAGDA
ncbi:PP2C family protein-serine/threonine phosphatase [Methylobacterium sp. J-076]|uniref:PP2C family protein-serine/threonine phosphatase n=1 Tax=Methylobacterium sp. J-076 TaxID=2836655 RepID=UPI001FB9CF9C|nr:PP2C family serine/threonine-protein phosphatase [Methylobacterium sp. J-076]MCJ2011869.1 serine/threonine-protein phosphatase [Methylobacterium sp. J-076]